MGKMSRGERVTSGEISVLSTDEYLDTDGPRSCVEPIRKTDFSDEFYGNYVAAESLHDMGFSIFPLWGITNGKCDCGNKDCKNQGKHPHKLALKGFYAASNKGDDIDVWWSEAPNANIGIRTGENLIVIDVDEAIGEDSLNHLQAKWGLLPETLEATTGRGRHLYFRKPTDIKIPCTNGVVANKIDIKAEGAYVVGPGSTHVSGKQYVWVDPSQPMVELPVEWVEALKKKAEATPQPRNENGKIPEGGRNDYLKSKGASLRRTGLSGDALVAALNAINQQDCEIPLQISQIRTMCRSTQKNIEAEPLPENFVHPKVSNVDLIETWGVTSTKEFPPTQWIVDGFLPIGLTILGGDSKAGKSWFILNLCKAVASGKVSFMGKIMDPQKVLYLALDDPGRRLQSRGKILNFDDVGLEDNFLSVNQWNRFRDPGNKKTNEPDGFEDLELALEKHQNIRLVIIDVWQKIRPGKKAFSDDYEKDYAHLSEIQGLAFKYNCAIMLLHHVTKGEHSEINDGLIGSKAVQGCADTIWMLKRDKKNKTGILTPSGKDSFDEEPLTFRCEEGIWEFMDSQREIKLTDNQSKVFSFIEANQPVSFSEIEKRSGIVGGSVSRALEALLTKNLIEKDEKTEKYRLRACLHVEENKELFS